MINRERVNEKGDGIKVSFHSSFGKNSLFYSLLIIDAFDKVEQCKKLNFSIFQLRYFQSCKTYFLTRQMRLLPFCSLSEKNVLVNNHIGGG